MDSLSRVYYCNTRLLTALLSRPKEANLRSRLLMPIPQPSLPPGLFLRLCTRRAFLTTPRPRLPLLQRSPLTSTPTPTLKMKESDIKRNPHPDFKSVEGSRPPFNPSTAFAYSQTPQPTWSAGDGANAQYTAADAAKSHVAIDPYAPDRSPVNNYKLLISAVIPRPIAFISTRSKDGDTTNLAPYSYFQLINHDPPLFVIGFASGLEAAARGKHSLHNLQETGECTINIISEHFVEAANSTSVNAPYGVSEWALSGLTPAYDCEVVKSVPRVKEAVFTIEGRLESVREFESRSQPGRMTGTLAVIEGVRFWAREDALNEERNLIDPAVLKAVSRLGGITYGRTAEGFELLRPDFEKDLGGKEGYEKLEKEKETAAGGKI